MRCSLFLLVSTFVMNGMVSDWAVNSPRHWFVRTAVVLGFLSPLLLARALEPFVTLLLQSATIAAVANFAWYPQARNPYGVTVQNPRQSKDLKQWIRPARFSLATILLATGLFATLLAIGTRMPNLNGNAWRSMVLIGVCSGLCVSVTQIGARYRNRSRTIPLMVLCSLLLAIPLAWFDWLIPSLIGWAGWHPREYFHRRIHGDRR